MDDYLRCKKCVEADHQGQFCLCEHRNIRVAQEMRSLGIRHWSRSQPERSKREDRVPPLTSSMTVSQYNQFMNETNGYMEIGCGALNMAEMS